MFLSKAAQLWDLMYGPIANDEVQFVCDVWSKFYDKNPKNILDIGCGTGRYVIPLLQKKLDVIGVDSSSAMLEILKLKATKYNVNPKLLNIDFSEFKTKDKFDLAFAFFSIVYLLEDEEIESFLQKASEVLQPGGIFLVNFFNAYEFWDKKGWKSSMARIFKGGHLKVNYSNKTKDRLRGVADVEDFRSFSREGQRPVFDLSVRPVRFHSPQSIQLFLQRAGFKDIKFHSGFGKELGPQDTRSPIITAVAIRS